MFDFVGVTDYHKDDDDSEGGVIKETPKKPKPNSTKLIEIDVDDWIDPDSRVIITLDDDGNIQRSPEEEEQSELIGIKFEGWLSTNEKLDYEKEKFLRVIGEQIKSNSKLISKIDHSLFAYPPFQGLTHAENKLGGKDKLERFVKEINNSIFNN
jgi:type I restriction enzyme R subunit